MLSRMEIKKKKTVEAKYFEKENRLLAGYIPGEERRNLSHTGPTEKKTNKQTRNQENNSTSGVHLSHKNLVIAEFTIVFAVGQR